MTLGLPRQTVVPPGRLGHLLRLDIGSHLGQRQVASGGNHRHQLPDDPAGVVLVTMHPGAVGHAGVDDAPGATVSVVSARRLFCAGHRCAFPVKYRRGEYSAPDGTNPFPPGRTGEHNDAVTYGQVGAVCPQCGSAAAVHSVEELAAMARTQLGEYSPGYAPPPPGSPAAPSGFPEAPLGYPAGPPPESWQGPGPPPGYTGQQRPGRRSSGGSKGSDSAGSGFDTDLGDEIADVVLTT